jgi:hypothetical protein
VIAGYGVQSVKWGEVGCIHTEHLLRFVDANVNAGRPFDSPPLQDNFASHILVNVVPGSCDTRTGECSAMASG